jgi:hypothetical protein
LLMGRVTHVGQTIGSVLLLLNQRVADRVIRCLDAIAFLVADCLDASEPGVNNPLFMLFRQLELPALVEAHPPGQRDETKRGPIGSCSGRHPLLGFSLLAIG